MGCICMVLTKWPLHVQGALAQLVREVCEVVGVSAVCGAREVSGVGEWMGAWVGEWMGAWVG